MRPFVTPPLSLHYNPRIQIAAFCSLGEGFPLARRWPAIDLVAASRLTHAHTHHTWCSGGGSSAAIIIMSLQPASAARRACVAAIATTTIDEEGANVKGPSMLLFSGGTAFNGVVEELKKFTTRVAHVLPVSDDGGSTAEIVRVLGVLPFL
jgi:hypothetical protein